MVSIANLLLVLSASTTGVLVAIAGIITFIYAIRRHNYLIFLFSAMWLLYGIFWFIDAAAHYYYSSFLMSIAILPQLIGVPCIFIFIELSRKENVSSTKITALFIIEIALLYVNFLPGGRVIIPGYGVHNKGILRIFQVVFLLYFVLFYFLWSFQTWKKAPHELKRLMNFHLFGSILFSIATATMYALGSFFKILNSVGFFINGIGAFITVVVVLKEPKIIYILPFKAYRILVVDTNEGLTLFKYDWAKLGEVEENIFSTVLQSIGSILDEILKKGEVREIQMDRAVLLIQHDKKYPIASVLISTKSTKSLRFGLRVFYDQFISNFYTLGDDLHEVSKFDKAKTLIETVFDFVPEYRKIA